MLRCLIALLTLAILLPLTAFGQRPSHLDDPDDALSPKDIARLLKGRGGKKGNTLLDSDMLRNLIKNMPRNMNPMQFDDETIRNILEQNPELKDPQTLDRLKKMVDEQRQETPNPGDPKVNWGNIEDTLKKVEDFHKRQPPPVNPIDPKDPNIRPDNPMVKQPTPPTQPPKERPPTPKNDRQSDEFVKWLTKNFGDSDTTRQIAKDFMKIMSQDGKNGGMPEFFKDIAKEWKGLAGDNKKSFGSDVDGLLKGLKLPDLKTPSMGGSSGSGGSSSGGSPPIASSSSSTSSSGGNWSGGMGGSSTGVLLILLIALGGFLYWYKYVRGKAEAEKLAEAGTHTWPVHPMAVATREDVVKAFEFLSISQCGANAVNWHHHQIAGAIGGKEPDKSEAADRLAGLYEKARYTPANELFTETEIAEARARLVQIAGAPSE